MLRIASLFGLIFFLIGQIMVFFTAKHDPINASLLMLGFLLMALSITHMFFIAYAPTTARLGTFLVFAGLFAHALLQFDIMGYGVTAQFSQPHRALGYFANIAPILGGVLLWLWWQKEDPKEVPRAAGFVAAACLFAIVNLWLGSNILLLLTSLMFTGGFLWLSLYKSEQY